MKPHDLSHICAMFAMGKSYTLLVIELSIVKVTPVFGPVLHPLYPLSVISAIVLGVNLVEHNTY